MIVANADLKSRIIALDSFQSYVVMIIQYWDDIGFGDADTSDAGEVARLASYYIDTYRTDILLEERDLAYQTVWEAFRDALPEITDPT